MAKKNLSRGIFITFEGFEGSGKSTHIRLLASFLRGNGYAVKVLREPGSTRIGEEIRKILLNKKNIHLCRETELLLYLAARSQIVKENILPALKEKNIVLCDRFQDATVAYQGFGLGLDKKLIDNLGKFATSSLVPDLTILLDITVKEGLRRAGNKRDRIEQRSLAYHMRVRQGYLKIARGSPQRVEVVRVIDGITGVQNKIRWLVGEFLCLFEK